MPQNTHLEIVTAEEEHLSGPGLKTRDPETLRAKAQELAAA